jgi:membrane protein involved in colicin uptake
MNELQVTVIPAQISANFAEMKERLLEEIAAYKIEVTDANLPDAKKAATELNKLSAQIEEARKNYSKQLKAPITAFDNEAKELTNIVQTARQDILKQVEVYTAKVLELVKNLLTEELARLNNEFQIKPEFQTAKIDGLVIQSNLTDSMKLSKAARDKLAAMVGADKAIQDTVASRLNSLQSIAERAGIHGLSESLVMPFIREPEAIYSAKLNQVIDLEIKRQKELEAKIQAEADRKAKEAAEVAEMNARHAAEAAQKQIDDANKRAAEAEESERKAKIALAMAAMEAEPAPVVEPEKPAAIPQTSKVFFVEIKAKFNVNPDSTREDVQKMIESIFAEHCGKVNEIKIIG